MRARTAIVAGVSVVAFGLTAGAAQAEDPPEQEQGGLITITSEDGLLPLCVNTIQVSVFGNQLLNQPPICIG